VSIRVRCATPQQRPVLQSGFNSAMERVGRVIGKLAASGCGLTEEELALAAWPAAVGKRLAMRTNAIALVRNRLVIEVEDAVWQRQLFTLRSQIIRQLENVAGRRLVEEVEFRVALPKRKPVRAETAAATSDDADGIRDPFLRNIYKAARKKATA
jgi:hypothetical protein